MEFSNDTDVLNFYDYDGDEEDLSENPEFIISLVFYGLVFFLGSIGNTLVIYCIAKYKRLQSITNQLLMSLACADLLLILICVPIKFARLMSFRWNFGDFLCKGVFYIQSLSMIASVITLTSISIERYYAISKPLRVKSHCTTKSTRFLIACTWMVACVLALPSIFVQVHEKQGLIRTVYVCQLAWLLYGWPPDKQILAISFEVYRLLLLFLLPVIIMISAYCGVCNELWFVTKMNRKGSRISTSAHSERGMKGCKDSYDDCDALTKTHLKEQQTRKQVMNMLIVVVLIFVLCWCPYLFYNLAVATELIKPYAPFEYPYAKPLNAAFSLLAYSNSCINPIIYGFMSRYFRKSFKQVLSSCCLFKDSKYSYYFRTPTQIDKTSSFKRADPTSEKSTKRSTLSTFADSTLSRSPPCTPISIYNRSETLWESNKPPMA